jgi:hypothetical protein
VDSERSEDDAIYETSSISSIDIAPIAKEGKVLKPSTEYYFQESQTPSNQATVSSVTSFSRISSKSSRRKKKAHRISMKRTIAHSKPYVAKPSLKNVVKYSILEENRTLKEEIVIKNYLVLFLLIWFNLILTCFQILLIPSCHQIHSQTKIKLK